jgi:hypothetical protein
VRRRVELHIDKLVLHGLSPAARRRIGPALEAELNRLVDVHGLPGALAEAGRVLRLPGASCTVAAGARGERIGAQVAGTLHRRFGGES